MKSKMKSKNYTQLCQWAGVVMSKGKTMDGTEQNIFESLFKKNFGVRVKYECEVETLPDIENGKVVKETGGRNDIFFYIHTDDIGKFAVPRLKLGIRWWEDVIKYNGGSKHLYTDEFLEKYQPTW